MLELYLHFMAQNNETVELMAVPTHHFSWTCSPGSNIQTHVDQNCGMTCLYN